jgi:3-hydroxyisobutyrate dehydrogenase-like beta-hydroxyacid dehydrogenase
MRVSVIGLGSMGATLARLLLAGGRQVTVWNRTPGKAAALIEAGAVLAPDAGSAIAASPVTLMCVHDFAAADAILGRPGVARALEGRLLVQLTTVSPREAVDGADRITQAGGRYLGAAIQAAPSQMGQPDTPLLVSGDQAAFRDVVDLLRALAGNVVYLGEQVDAAATMDFATLSYVYGSYLGFMHGSRLAEARGVDVARYGEIVRAIAPSFGAFFEHQAGVIRSGDFRVSESPLSISLQATARILAWSQESGIDTQVPRLFAGLLQRAAEAGYDKEELAALIKVFRAATPA